MSDEILLPCRGVLFDCDGVLVDSRVPTEAAWSRWCIDHGFDPDEILPTIHGRRAGDTIGQLLPAGEVAAALAKLDAMELETAGETKPIPGSPELTRALPQGGWAVVTSGNRELAPARLTAAGVPLPTVLITADDVTHGKPHPEPYATAAERLGLAAAETVVVEDVPAGVQAGRAAGASAVIGVGRTALESDADVVVRDLSVVRWTGEGLAVRRDGLLR